jgi:hypothetical protein
MYACPVCAVCCDPLPLPPASGLWLWLVLLLPCQLLLRACLLPQL